MTPEEENALLDKAAASILKRRMETPAIMALEMHKPLANVGASAAIVFAPFLVPVMGFERLNDFTRVLRKRENIELLIQKLENSKGSKAAPATIGGPA